MRSILICLVLVGAVLAEREHVEREKDESQVRGGSHFDEQRFKLETESAERRKNLEHERSSRVKDEKKGGEFKIDDRTKEILLKQKYERPEVFLNKALEFFLNNPNREFERQCFAKFKPGESIDFVIDVAASPEQDKVDKLIGESPIAYYLALWHQTPSKAYFNAIRGFIDAVTYDMKPEFTHSIIVDDKKKFYIRGESIETGFDSRKVGDFIDSKRNLKTMWPVNTKSTPADSFLRPVLKNNLGRMTKLALWNRDNGLPVVLNDHRRSKPVYTIVISDGASGSKITDLCDDLTRTTVIDIGNRRFVNNIDWSDMRRLVSVVTLNAPQQLAGMVDTCRLMACKACGC